MQLGSWRQAYRHASVYGIGPRRDIPRLRKMLRAHAAGLTTTADTPSRFCLEAVPGPATVAAWGGQVRRPTIPVAWVERGKSYVSYHLMGLDGSAAVVASLPPGLRARMQGKTCFNFQRPEAALLAELDSVTAASIAGLQRAGVVEAASHAEQPG